MLCFLISGMEVLEYVPGPKAPVGCLASDLISLGVGKIEVMLGVVAGGAARRIRSFVASFVALWSGTNKK